MRLRCDHSHERSEESVTGPVQGHPAANEHEPKMLNRIHRALPPVPNNVSCFPPEIAHNCHLDTIFICISARASTDHPIIVVSGKRFMCLLIFTVDLLVTSQHPPFHLQDLEFPLFTYEGCCGPTPLHLGSRRSPPYLSMSSKVDVDTAFAVL